MAEAGVYTQASLNAGMTGTLGGGGGQVDAAKWTFIIFGAAVGFILVVYFGFGGHRGAVAS